MMYIMYNYSLKNAAMERSATTCGWSRVAHFPSLGNDAPNHLSELFLGAA